MFFWEVFCFRKEQNDIPFILPLITEFTQSRRNCVLLGRFSRYWEYADFFFLEWIFLSVTLLFLNNKNKKIQNCPKRRSFGTYSVFGMNKMVLRLFCP